jgi:hypothetical protein
LPFAVYAGIASNDPEAQASLEAKAQQLAVKLDVDHLEFRNVSAKHSNWPTQDLYVTFRKEILPDAEANMLAIPRKQRAMVRKGIKNCLKSQVDRAATDFSHSLLTTSIATEHRHYPSVISTRCSRFSVTIAKFLL